MEFGSALLNSIGAFYNAPDEPALAARATEIRSRFVQLEAAIGDGPWFAGEQFSIVDAVCGPVFRYFDVFDAIDDFGMWSDLPRVTARRALLASRPSVMAAVRPEYPALLRAFLAARRGSLSRRMAPEAVPG